MREFFFLSDFGVTYRYSSILALGDESCMLYEVINKKQSLIRLYRASDKN